MGDSGGQEAPGVDVIGTDTGIGGAGVPGGSGGDARGSTGGIGGQGNAGLPDGGGSDADTIGADGLGGQGGAGLADAGGPDADSGLEVAGGQPDASSPVAISVDFVGGGTPITPAEIAGLFPAASWNSAAGISGTLTALIESSGAASSATVTWDGGGVWQLPVTDAPGNTRMMTGYLDPRTTSIVDVAALPASLSASGYDVYVYTNGDVPANTIRVASYAIGAITRVVTEPESSAFSGTFIEAVDGGSGNYVVFRGITGSSFRLTYRPVSGTGLRAPLNGLQIVTAGAGP